MVVAKVNKGDYVWIACLVTTAREGTEGTMVAVDAFITNAVDDPESAIEIGAAKSSPVVPKEMGTSGGVGGCDNLIASRL